MERACENGSMAIDFAHEETLPNCGTDRFDANVGLFRRPDARKGNARKK